VTKLQRLRNKPALLKVEYVLEKHQLKLQSIGRCIDFTVYRVKEARVRSHTRKAHKAVRVHQS
jgi:hypothetical protein